MNRATEIILKIAYSSAIILAAILKQDMLDVSPVISFPPSLAPTFSPRERERRLGARETPGIILIFKRLMCLILS